MRGRFSTPAGRAALGGVLAAGSLAVLWLASVAPTGQLGLAAAAGLFPVAAVLSAGRGAGWLCWAAASLLGLLLVPGKGAVLLYLCFLGCYPVAKSALESQRSRPLEWLGKFAFFNVALTVLLAFFRTLFLPTLPAWMADNVWVLYGAGNLAFLAYDIALSRLIGALGGRLFSRGR